MRLERIVVSSFALVAGLLLISDSAAGQDVLEIGRVRGVQPPQWVLETLQRDPTAFQFRRAWKHKVRRIREVRASVRPMLGPSYSPSQLAVSGAAVTGVLSVPVIAGLFSDATAPFTQAEYQQRLYGDGMGTVSVSEYYAELSGGQFGITGLVSDWVGLPNTASYYESNGDPKYGEAGEFMRDALTAVDPGFDFSQFDNDGPDGVPNSGDDDGYVDVVAFIYPSVPRTCGGASTGIWPHRWVYEAWYGVAFVTDDAAAGGGFIRISDYTIQSGVGCTAAQIMGSGTLSHELGHALGLPDLYDYDGSSRGIGYWGLMAAGNWNSQTSPAHMCAWSRDYLGWLNVTTLTESALGYGLSPVQTSRAVVRIDIPGTNEYFLLSNRQRIGSDAYLLGTGLLVWHVDEDVTAEGYGINDDENHKGVDLEEADGQYDLDFNRNGGDSGDPYPGTSGNTTFDGGSDPNSHNYVGAASGVAVRNISFSGNLASFDIVISAPVILWGDVDGNGAVTIADVDLIYDYAIGYIGDVTGLMAYGDVDADGDVDMRDGLITHSFVSGIDTSGYRVGEEAPPAGAPRLFPSADRLDPLSPLPGVRRRLIPK